MVAHVEMIDENRRTHCLLLHWLLVPAQLLVQTTLAVRVVRHPRLTQLRLAAFGLRLPCLHMVVLTGTFQLPFKLVNVLHVPLQILFVEIPVLSYGGQGVGA